MSDVERLRSCVRVQVWWCAAAFVANITSPLYNRFCVLWMRTNLSATMLNHLFGYWKIHTSMHEINMLEKSHQLLIINLYKYSRYQSCYLVIEKIINDLIRYLVFFFNDSWELPWSLLFVDLFLTSFLVLNNNLFTWYFLSLIVFCVWKSLWSYMGIINACLLWTYVIILIYKNTLFDVFINIFKLRIDFLHRCMHVIGPKSFHVFINVESRNIIFYKIINKYNLTY